jgi:hypothetical protein
VLWLFFAVLAWSPPTERGASANGPQRAATGPPLESEADAATRRRRAVIGWGSGLLGLGGAGAFAALVPIPVMEARHCKDSEASSEFCAPRWKWNYASAVTLATAGVVTVAGAIVLGIGMSPTTRRKADTTGRIALVRGRLALRF